MHKRGHGRAMCLLRQLNSGRRGKWGCVRAGMKGRCVCCITNCILGDEASGDALCGHRRVMCLLRHQLQSGR